MVVTTDRNFSSGRGLFSEVFWLLTAGALLSLGLVWVNVAQATDIANFNLTSGFQANAPSDVNDAFSRFGDNVIVKGEGSGEPLTSDSEAWISKTVDSARYDAMGFANRSDDAEKIDAEKIKVVALTLSDSPNLYANLSGELVGGPGRAYTGDRLRLANFDSSVYSVYSVSSIDKDENFEYFDFALPAFASPDFLSFIANEINLGAREPRLFRVIGRSASLDD
jgi:hypothetical protein